MFGKLNNIAPGLLLSACVAVIAMLFSSLIPGDIIGATVMALLVGMMLNPIISGYKQFNAGISFAGKLVLRLGIILMGVNLNFTEVLSVGKYSLFVMIFTMATAFGAGNLIGKLFGTNWKLTNLLSVSTAICGGSAVAAVGPVIRAKDEDVAYAISSTFIFDVLTVVIIPWIGVALGMSSMGYGLWVGTAVNDTSSVVAAGYAFSEFAGNTAVIVKLTRTLFIIPFVLIFSIITERLEARSEGGHGRISVNLRKIFPYFIIFFLVIVAIRSTGIIPGALVDALSRTSKFCMVMALSAIGLKTSFTDIKNIGFKPMILGFIVDTLVVFVSIGVQVATGRF
ncbi:YeiH family protein [Youngiibacter multivorans]|uniref:Integral membrane protein (TIGR00698 family) n=1 Tax=Youngiibacter multivorans TaxID=937251 RepID=A0ABS4G311_9CLOT|nr:YeiH family protein [Youngiibacter multivorans]MBP1918924.1 putative integral membrane protein (TIGR00698 family) [Youngiibacter multivorans]